MFYKRDVRLFKCALILSRKHSIAKFHESIEALKYFRRKKGDVELLTFHEMKEKMEKRHIYTSWLERQSRLEKIVSLPENQTLEPRELGDSFSCTLIPFSTDDSLHEKYVSFMDHLRPGRLLESLDSFAVWVASNHICKEKNEPLKTNIVTLLVDAVEFAATRLNSKQDIRLTGYVSWCSRSTIETELYMEQEESKDNWSLKTRARFLMAARDPQTGKAKEISPLITTNDFEETFLKKASTRRKEKRDEATKTVYKVGPNAQDSELLHQLLFRSFEDQVNFPFSFAHLPKDILLVENARLSTTTFSHPEDRNLYNTVFGGYLMRIATELSWSCVFHNTKQLPDLLAIGDIKFHKPVPLASLLRAKAFIVFTEKNTVVTTVIIHVHDPKTGEMFRTNDFHFYYKIEGSVPRVMPRSYEFGLMFLEGRQFLMNMKKSASK